MSNIVGKWLLYWAVVFVLASSLSFGAQSYAAMIEKKTQRLSDRIEFAHLQREVSLMRQDIILYDKLLLDEKQQREFETAHLMNMIRKKNAEIELFDRFLYSGGAP